MVTETPQPEKKKAPLPKVVTLNKALKLAQTWVDKMTASDPDEPHDKDFEGRPSGYIDTCLLLHSRITCV